jgi:hypothetical protein
MKSNDKAEKNMTSKWSNISLCVGDAIPAITKV